MIFKISGRSKGLSGLPRPGSGDRPWDAHRGDPNPNDITKQGQTISPALRSRFCPRTNSGSVKIIQTRPIPRHQRSSPERKINSWWWRVCDSSFLTFCCLLSPQRTLGDYRMIGCVCVIVTEWVTPFLESMTEARGRNGAGSDEWCTWRQPLPCRPPQCERWIGLLVTSVRPRLSFDLRCGTLAFLGRMEGEGDGDQFKSLCTFCLVTSAAE